MEFLIGNVFHKSLKKMGTSLYYKGDFQEGIQRNIVSEGYIVDDDIKDASDYCSRGLNKCYAKGAYNIISYSIDTGLLEFKNDRRGTVAAYLYRNQKSFIISNNIWNIVELLDDVILIDPWAVKVQLAYFCDYTPGRTLFKNIEIIDSAIYLSYLPETGLNIKKYWEFTYMPDDNLKINDVVDELDSSFTMYFRKIHEQNPNGIMGFGNSGGFDSRILAYYAVKEEIPTNSYVIAQERPHILRSTTALLSEKISKALDLHTEFIEYPEDNIYNQMLIDVRNAPLVGSQLFINPYHCIPYADYLMSGEPGGICYLADNIMSGDPERLRLHADFFFGRRKLSISMWKNIIRKAFGHLGIPFKRNDGLLGLTNSYLDKVLIGFDPNALSDEFGSIIKQLPGKNNIEKWINLNGLLNKNNYRAGYLSLSGTKKSYLLYYPFFYEILAKFPLNFFEDRFVLKNIIQKIGLNHIPGQNMQLVNMEHSHFYRLSKKIEMGLRGRGLNCEYLLKRQSYRKISMDIICRDNPLFYNVVDKKKLIASQFLKTYSGMSFIKMKLFLDIYYYKKFHLLKNPQFVMAD
jgi:hypothetical protein